MVKADANNLYNAGMLMTVYASNATGDDAIAAYQRAENIFNEAIATGYADESGNIYYYLFHSYYGQKDVNRDEFLPKAKNALLEGIKLYPKNSTILDGLMNLYTAEEGIGDPAELTTMIEESLKADPTNYDLWFGRGRVYNAMKNYDECIKSFKKCVELRPEDYDANFYTGYFIIEKANAQIEALNPDGVIISSGPGCPTDAGEVMATVKELWGKYPMFGIGLGCQLICLAKGATVDTLPHGHRGGYPVRCCENGKITSTAQNHAYAVNRDSLAGTGLTVLYENVTDLSVEGVKDAENNVIGVQFAPESAPGPQDNYALFDRFITMMKEDN